MRGGGGGLTLRQDGASRSAASAAVLLDSLSRPLLSGDTGGTLSCVRCMKWGVGGWGGRSCGGDEVMGERCPGRRGEEGQVCALSWQ